MRLPGTGRLISARRKLYRRGSLWLFDRAAELAALAGSPLVAGGNDAWAEFCPRVIQCVQAAGYTPASQIAPDAAFVPSGYTGPRLVYSTAGGAGPVVFMSAPGTSTMTMAQPAEQQNGDLLVFVVSYSTGTPALAPASGSSVAQQVSADSFSNGRLQLWILPYATGDGAPTFTGATNFWWGIGFILRKPGGVTPLSDQQALDTASLVGNFGLFSPSFVTPTQNNSAVIWYFTQYAPASANAQNQLIGPQLGWGQTAGSAQNPETWPIISLPAGFSGLIQTPLWIGVSYRLDKARTAQVMVPYIGNAASASNNPAGVANFY